MARAKTASLTDDEIDLARRCLTAALEGPYFPDWEFSTLIGANKHEARSIASRWPEVQTQEELTIVNNVVVNLWGYPHGSMASLCERLSVTEVELESLRKNLKHLSRGVQGTEQS